MRVSLPAILLTLALTGPAGAAGGGLLQALAGSWQGRAVTTPVGPTPYDIEFRRRPEGCIIGTADNGFSHHTWTFCRRDGALKLGFLSDFRGNDRTIHLREIDRRGATVVFHADSHPFLDVQVTPGEDTVRVDVLHDQRLHVHIVWRRPVGD